MAGRASFQTPEFKEPAVDGVLFFDFDGVTNQAPPETDIPGTSQEEYKKYQLKRALDIHITNVFAYQILWGVCQRNNVLLLSGSQRIVFSEQDALEQPMRKAMFDAYDKAFGPYRAFFKKNHADLIREKICQAWTNKHHTPAQITGNDKSIILDAVKFIPGCENIPANRVCLVDDNARYREAALEKGYQFIHAKRYSENPQLDRLHIVEAMLLMFPNRQQLENDIDEFVKNQPQEVQAEAQQIKSVIADDYQIRKKLADLNSLDTRIKEIKLQAEKYSTNAKASARNAERLFLLNFPTVITPQNIHRHFQEVRHFGRCYKLLEQKNNVEKAKISLTRSVTQSVLTLFNLNIDALKEEANMRFKKLTETDNNAVKLIFSKIGINVMDVNALFEKEVKGENVVTNISSFIDEIELKVKNHERITSAEKWVYYVLKLHLSLAIMQELQAKVHDALKDPDKNEKTAIDCMTGSFFKALRSTCFALDRIPAYERVGKPVPTDTKKLNKDVTDLKQHVSSQFYPLIGVSRFKITIWFLEKTGKLTEERLLQRVTPEKQSEARYWLALYNRVNRKDHNAQTIQAFKAEYEFAAPKTQPTFFQRARVWIKNCFVRPEKPAQPATQAPVTALTDNAVKLLLPKIVTPNAAVETSTEPPSPKSPRPPLSINPKAEAQPSNYLLPPTPSP